MFNEKEKKALSQAAKAEDWYTKSTALTNAKSKIKKHNKIKQNNCCCYCRTSFHGVHNASFDTEHIIPSSLLPRHMFHPKNLSVACKRCNMTIKNKDISFLTSPTILEQKNKYLRRNYKFIHPNLDRYDTHINIVRIQVKTKMLLYFDVLNNSEKGKFTYDYFKLKDLEVNSFNNSQNITDALILDKDLFDAFKRLSQ